MIKQIQRWLRGMIVIMAVWLLWGGSEAARVQNNSEIDECIYLSGMGSDDAVDWEFYCSGGRNSGFWTTIPVPSNWEQHGFGSYTYYSGPKDDEQGKYRKTFDIPAAWQGRRIILVFEGSMTDTEAFVNGRSVGPKHQGGFYRFQYDISDLANLGKENLLEVNVSKVSSDESVNKAEREADYWGFGGIFRPVYLLTRPQEYIDWTAIDAKADGSFTIDVHLANVNSADAVAVQIIDAAGTPIGSVFRETLLPGQVNVALRTRLSAAKTWTAETPNLYRAVATLQKGQTVLHEVSERFGFRTIEVRQGDGIYLNGQKIRLKGVNRHSFWPDTARALNRQISYDDARLIKEMNMNAVRMSHYPPDKHFLEACDELGLYVINELAGWQAAYDTQAGRPLVALLVKRDVNHPCILFWANGNEGGWNTDLDGDYALYDPQKRAVLHPWATFSGINTAHYRNYAAHTRLLTEGRDIVMPTEFLHGLYDGGSGAGLNDYWKAINYSPRGAGGFLWALLDEGVVRTDQNGRIDNNGNSAPDGIVGPYRQKEGSYYAIKEIWSPVQVTLEDVNTSFDGEIPVENDYAFTNLNQCRFEWKWADIDASGHHVLQQGSRVGPDIAPGQRGQMQIDVPADWRQRDVLYVTAFDPTGAEVFTWSWPLKTPEEYRKSIVQTGTGRIRADEKDDVLTLSAGPFVTRFDLSSGYLLDAGCGGQQFSFGNGPRFVPSATFERNDKPVVSHGKDGDGYGVQVKAGDNIEFCWTFYPSGWLRLEYSMRLSDTVDFLGVTFDYPEDKVLAKSWLGDGPYHVWKNRMRGTRFDAFHNVYNNPMPGQTYEYPEFKGYFSSLYKLELITRQGAMTVLTDTSGLFARLYTPSFGQKPQTAVAAMPEGDISFLHEISAIGTKFLRPDQMGPESRPASVDGTRSGSLYFYFGQR